MRHIIASSILLSSLFLPAAASASTPADDATAPTQAPRISTGVIAPSLIQSTDLNIPADYPQEAIPVNAQIGLTLTVDEKGRPQNIQVVKGINPFWDARIVEAVSKFHYRPGTIDEKPIPVGMNLTVNIAR
ncbi:MAG TPA: energy transducer TonB [Terracidiphilus sp.]|nr:energy transducer TonB [Terracidiphilus sp.]